MDKKELAKKMNISLKTLYNWEKEKPELIKLLNMGLALNKQIDETKKYLEKLENIKQKAESGKLQLK